MSPARLRLASAYLGVGALLHGADMESQLDAELKSLQSSWNVSGALSGSAGYKDNVLLSTFAPQGSPQLRTEADLMVWRMPVHVADFVWFTSASESLFTSIHGDGRTETSLLSRAEFRYQIPGFFKASLATTGAYMDQVLDLSETSVESLRLKARNTLLKLTPSLFWKPLHAWWFDVEASILASRYAGVNEDADGTDVQLRLGRDFLGTQAAGIRAAWTGRHYLDRNQYTRGGRALMGTRLSLERPEAGLFWKGAWGETCRFGAELDVCLAWNHDDGSGFFDHDRAQASLKINYKTPAWTLSVRTSAWRSLYGVQVAGEGFDPPRRRIVQVSGRARVEHPVARAWTLFAELEGERSSDNTPGGDYRSSGLLLGTEHSW